MSTGKMRNRNAARTRNSRQNTDEKMEKKNSNCPPEQEIWEGKIYKLVDESNFDSYLQALGVGPVLRKIGNSVRPVIALRKNNKCYSLITASDFATTILRFQLCKPFDEETLDGRKMRTTMSMFNNVLIQHQLGDMPSTIVREFHDTKMIAKYMVGDVEAVRIFQVADEEMCKKIWEENESKSVAYQSGTDGIFNCWGSSKNSDNSDTSEKSKKTDKSKKQKNK